MYVINKKDSFVPKKKSLNTMLQDTNRSPSVASQIYILYTALRKDPLLINSLSCWKALDIHCYMGTTT